MYRKYLHRTRTFFYIFSLGGPTHDVTMQDLELARPYTKQSSWAAALRTNLHFPHQRHNPVTYLVNVHVLHHVPNYN